MLREITEIESIGDACNNIAHILRRKQSHKEDFTEQQYASLRQMFGLTDAALTQMVALLVGYRDQLDARQSFRIENDINNLRNQLRAQNINDIDNRLYTYAIGTLYMDIVQECEKLGDYVVNVVEARMGVKQSEA
jgi:phosphate:Na+ symporter